MCRSQAVVATTEMTGKYIITSIVQKSGRCPPVKVSDGSYMKFYVGLAMGRHLSKAIRDRIQNAWVAIHHCNLFVEFNKLSKNLQFLIRSLFIISLMFPLNRVLRVVESHILQYVSDASVDHARRCNTRYRPQDEPFQAMDISSMKGVTYLFFIGIALSVMSFGAEMVYPNIPNTCYQGKRYRA